MKSNIIFRSLIDMSRYWRLVLLTFRSPQNFRVFYERIKEEVNVMILNSIPIVVISSFFMGAILTIQTAYNLSNPLVQKTIISFATRQVSILEFGPTIISVVLAGKVGSSIATQIASMKVSEQITALKIMGVNAESYIILPKVLVAVFFNPIIIFFAMVICIVGGWIGGVYAGVITHADYKAGLFQEFDSFAVSYAFLKTVVFGFIIATVSAFCGYFADEKGGAVEVGKCGTKAVVLSNVMIFVFNLILTDLILA